MSVEPVATTALSKLLSTVATGVVKRLLPPPAAGAGLVDDPVRLSSWLSWRGSRSKLTESEVGRLVAGLVLRAGDDDSTVRLLGPERGEAVVTALTSTLLALDALTLDDVVDAKLDPSRLATRLGAAAPAARGLDGQQAHLYDALLRACCAQIVDYFSKRPEFLARAAVAQTASLSELSDRIPDAASEADKFEAILREALLPRLDQEQLFGLRLPVEDQTYQLSTAYVSLTLRWTEAGGDDDAGRPHRARGHSDVVAGRRFPVTGENVRVEDALAEHRRLVIEGPAGAGKSTLLRRLALHAVRGDLPKLTEWHGKVPFLLLLRNFVQDDRLTMPRPEAFVAAVADLIADEKPGPWVSGLLRDGRAVVLADGIDEVPEKHRLAVLDWLERLTEVYRDAVYVVSSRPAAMTEDLRDRLRRAGFAAARLEPMTQRQVEDFIERWHSAALPDDPATAAEHVAALRNALLARRDLAQLATTPLLCAMMCALNRNNNRYLPHGRAALYNDALTMLLERREREQHIPAAPVPLSRDQLEPMLSRLAIWMTMNGRRTIPTAVARGEIDEPLRRVRGMSAEAELTAEAALALLVQRSGLLQEPAVDLLGFRHPSFQDYLAAVEIFQHKHLEHLLRNAHDPLYHDVAIMAVGQTQRDAARQRQLLTGIIERAETDREHGRRLWLLAAACIADVGMADRELARQIHRETRRLLPPKSVEEADTVARAGEFVLDLLAEAALRRQRPLTDQEAAATVRAAALIGGEAAMPLLRRFRQSEADEVQRELVAAWFRWPQREAYADEILADAALERISVDLTDPGYLPLLPRLRRLRRLGLPPDTPAAELDALLASDGFLAVLSRLTSLDLRGTQLADAARLMSLDRLQALDLSGTQVTDLAPMASLPNLEQLHLGGTPVSDLGPLAGLRNLTKLDLSGTPVTDLAPLAGLTRLRDLWLFRSQVRSLLPVSGHPGLTVALHPPQAELLRRTLGNDPQCKIIEL